MFIHNINPILLKIGFLEVRYYGLVYLIGLLLVYWFLIKKREFLGMNKGQVENLVFYSFIGMIVGARIFHFLIADVSVFWRDPLELFKIWHGGMSFFGSFILIIIISGWYLKKIKKNFWKVSEVFILPITFTLFLGRLANFINGELVGTVSNISWCFVFPGFSECRHPYQIYAAVSMLVLFVILCFIKKYRLIYFTILYSVLRFITDFFREDLRYFGLTVWQYFCIFFFILGIFFLLKKRR